MYRLVNNIPPALQEIPVFQNHITLFAVVVLVAVENDEFHGIYFFGLHLCRSDRTAIEVLTLGVKADHPVGHMFMTPATGRVTHQPFETTLKTSNKEEHTPCMAPKRFNMQ